MTLCVEGPLASPGMLGARDASTLLIASRLGSLSMTKRLVNYLVGAIGFEPTTPCAQGRCATRLRYAPT